MDDEEDEAAMRTSKAPAPFLDDADDAGGGGRSAAAAAAEEAPGASAASSSALPGESDGGPKMSLPSLGVGDGGVVGRRPTPLGLERQQQQQKLGKTR